MGRACEASHPLVSYNRETTFELTEHDLYLIRAANHVADHPAWKEAVYDLIVRSWGVGQVFSLGQVYLRAGDFERLFPGNNHVRDKIRQILQFLREDGILDFVDNNGHYRRVR